MRAWPALRTATSATAGLLLATAGLVAGASLDEAFALLTGALMLSGLAWLLGGPERKAATQRAQEDSAALALLHTELQELRAWLQAQPPCAAQHLDGPARAPLPRPH